MRRRGRVAAWRTSRWGLSATSPPSRRELKRNATAGSYCPDQAHRQALERRRDKPRQRSHVRETVSILVKWDWSPEQISLWLAQERITKVSHEWIYQYIYADKRSGGELHTHLRCQKKRRKRLRSRLIMARSSAAMRTSPGCWRQSSTSPTRTHPGNGGPMKMPTA